MIREVDLVSYLPPFVAEYKETNLALTAENPEFVLVWEAADKVLKNEFIITADEYGISRFEKILNILPVENETLESRRTRVMAKWFMHLPYTQRMLVKNLAIICADNDFRIYYQSGMYEIKIQVLIEPETESLLGQVQQMLENFLPANIGYQVTGCILRKRTTKVYMKSEKSFYVKIKGNPGLTQSSWNRASWLKNSTITMEYIKGIYLPERGQK